MFQHSTSNKKTMTITECVNVCVHNCDEMVESTQDTLFFLLNNHFMYTRIKYITDKCIQSYM